MPTPSTRRSLARAIAVPGPSGLLTLPTELLREIVEYLDSPSLIEFALTCKGVHYIALNNFFSRKKISLPEFQGRWFFIAPDAHVGTMKALRVALFLHDFSMLHYYFAKDKARFLEDATDMCRLLESRPYIEKLYLDFPILFPYRYPPTTIDRMHCKHVLTRALDAAIQRSCQELIVGATNQPIFEELKNLPQDISLTRRTTRSMKRNKGAIPPKKYNKLVTVRILDAMFLRPTFYDWTTSTLYNASSTLKTLELEHHYSHILPEQWKYFLEGLTLPELTTFKVDQTMIYGQPAVEFSILRDFLLRHFGITSLWLHGVGCPDTEMPLRDIPCFSCLVDLNAHPSWVSVLLSKMLASGSFTSAGDAVIGLKSISLSTNHCGIGVYDNPDFNSFDTAIQQIAMLPPRNNITLSLQLIHNSQHGLADWLTKHITLGPTESVLGQLKSISNVAFSSYPIHPFTPDIINLMPAFIGLLPCVRSVAFGFYEHKEIIFNSSYLEQLADASSTLNAVTSFLTSVDLKETRSNQS